MKTTKLVLLFFCLFGCTYPIFAQSKMNEEQIKYKILVCEAKLYYLDKDIAYYENKKDSLSPEAKKLYDSLLKRRQNIKNKLSDYSAELLKRLMNKPEEVQQRANEKKIIEDATQQLYAHQMETDVYWRTIEDIMFSGTHDGEKLVLDGLINVHDNSPATMQEIYNNIQQEIAGRDYTSKKYEEQRQDILQKRDDRIELITKNNKLSEQEKEKKIIDEKKTVQPVLDDLLVKKYQQDSKRGQLLQALPKIEKIVCPECRSKYHQTFDKQ